MNDLTSIRFSYWTDGRYDMCSLNMDRSEGCEGPKYIWFVFQRSELEGIASGKINAVVDLRHNLLIRGDVSIFYDLDFPARFAGKVEVPYVGLLIPQVFYRFLFKIARKGWAAERKLIAEKHGETYGKHELNISLETLIRFQRRYGQGLGEIDQVYSPEVLAEIGASADFAQNVAQVEQIARNLTRCVYHTARCQISGRNGDFYFSTSHKDRRSLNGGIIRHQDGNYSIHT